MYLKRLLPIVVVLFTVIPLLRSQVITSTPAFVIENGSAVITFDAAQGDKGLMGYTGDVYAHTGVITNLSTGDSDWKYVKAAWSENRADCKLTSLGNNKWQLSISPDIRTFYGVTNSAEQIRKIVFVFRSSDGTKTGRDTGGKDIFVAVYQPGLNISLTSPAADISLVNKSSSMTVTATASQPATLKLFINQTQLGTTQTNASSISSSYTFSTEGNYYLIAEAVIGTDVKRDSAYVCVRPATVPTASRPAGIKDGINYISNNQVTLSLFAQGKSYVYLLGDFNDWKPDNNYQMKKDGDYFWITLSGLTPGKEYGFQYYIDGSIRCGDPYSEKILDPWNDKWISSAVYPNLKPYPTGKTDDVVSVFQTAKTAYNWQITSFTPPAVGNLLIYELLIRDFTPEGTVNAAYNKLDYIQSLGVNAIELMPISEFDGNDSWGYNPNFWMATDKAYGTPDDYKRFIDECHRRGIAVILDVVFNHSWGLSPMAKMWWDATNNRPATTNPYLFPIAMHPYNVGSDFNHSSAYTRSYFKEVLKYWLGEYKIDGYRFDLSKGFTPETFYTTDVTTWGNYNQGRIDILSDYNQTIKAAKSNAYTILEHFAVNSEETVLANAGMMLWGNVNYAFSQGAMGVQAGSDFTGITANSRGWSTPQLVGYMESHDEERLAYKAKSAGVSVLQNDSVLRFKQLAADAALGLMAPGPKLIWQFGELGYDYSIDYNGRTGRKPVRWDYITIPERKAIYDKYSKILNFRQKYPTLFSNPSSFNWQMTASDWSNGKRIYLNNGTVTAIAVSNLTATGTITVTPAFGKSGIWYDLISGEAINVTDINMSLQLPAGEFRIYTDALINSVSETKASSVEVYPNPATDYLYIKGKQATGIELYSTSGVRVYQNKVSGQSVNLSTLPAGLYIGRVGFDDGTVAECKVCKQ